MIATSPSLDAVQIRCQGTGPGNTTLAEAIASDERISHSQPLLPVSPVLPCHRPRLSTDSRHTASTSCVSHVLHSAYAPPVPSLPAVYSHNENAVEVDVSLRPLQITGSLTLSPEDIRIKDDDDILPALAMMRTGSCAPYQQPRPTDLLPWLKSRNNRQTGTSFNPPAPITMPEPTPMTTEAAPTAP